MPEHIPGEPPASTPTPPEAKPAHHQSIQHVLSDEVVTKAVNTLHSHEKVMSKQDSEFAEKLKEHKAFIKEIRGLENQGILSEDEAIEIEAAHGVHRERELEKQLLTDEKSKLYNERGFKLMLGRRVSEARRTREKFVVSYWDLKGFKQVNDTLGHDTGDQVFAIIGILLETELREDDAAARLHGDEFAILYSRGDYEKIKQRWQAIRDDNLPDVVAKTLTAMGVEDPPHVTTSMGFYEVDPANNESVDEILKKADKAMYEDKKAQYGEDATEEEITPEIAE